LPESSLASWIPEAARVAKDFRCSIAFSGEVGTGSRHENASKNTAGAAAAALIRVVLQCYYRDDRVLYWLGLELRPPFPEGYVLEQGDWSLLDPVKARPSMWRRVK
jgi:hypothetical protein